MSKHIIKGDELQLFLQDGAPKFATSHTLTLSGSTLETDTKDHGFWGASEVGKLTWELTAECLYTDGDYDAMFDMMIAHTPITLTFAKVKNYSVNGLSSVGGNVAAWIPDVVQRRGNAYVTSLTANANTGENATYSITFTGAGPLKTIDNTLTDYSIKVTYNDDTKGMTLFNMRAYPYINSAWVVPEGGRPVQIDMSDGKLHDATPTSAHYFIYYLSGPAIPEQMFSGVTTINTVEATNTISIVGQYAFNNSSLTEISIPGPTPINYGNGCFSNCNFLTHVNYSSGNGRNWLNAKHVNNSSFLNCTRLEDIVLGESCDYILLSGFGNCLAISNVWFGHSLIRVNERAFYVDSHETHKDFHFYTEKAPFCEELAFGNVGYQSFILHNASSVEDFLSGTDMETIYPQAQCDYQIAS